MTQQSCGTRECATAHSTMFWPGWASSVHYSSHIPGTSGYHYSPRVTITQSSCSCTLKWTVCIHILLHVHCIYTCTKLTLSVLNVCLQLSAENERLKSELESYKEKYRKEKQK